MATHHAASGEVVDLATWANDLEWDTSKAITKSAGLELARLVIDAGYEMHPSDWCHVPGEVVIHCLEGEVDVRTPSGLITLRPGQLVYFEGGAKHALTGVKRSVVLLSIVLVPKRPG